MALTKADALAILERCGIIAGEDFHALSRTSVDKLLAEADARKYRKPRNANGSRARYFHAYVVRRATNGLTFSNGDTIDANGNVPSGDCEQPASDYFSRLDPI